MRVAFATASLIVFANALLAREPMEAILVVPDQRILPGVPFDFWVELHNGSENVRHIAVCNPFQMRLVWGEPLIWTDTHEQMKPRREFYWENGGDAIVGPGETKVLAIPASSASPFSDFFRNRLLSAPGRRVAIALPLCSADRTGSATLITNEVEIEIMTPAGSDAEVWDRIDATSLFRWTPADMALPQSRTMWESVLRDYPDSNYVPYAVLMTTPFQFNDSRSSLARQLRTIKRFPDSPVVEWLHIQAWQTARALRLHGVMLAEGAIVRRSKRPTTRVLSLGYRGR